MICKLKIYSTNVWRSNSYIWSSIGFWIVFEIASYIFFCIVYIYMIEHWILNSIWDCIVYLFIFCIELYALPVFSLSVSFLLYVSFSCFYFVVFSLSFCPFQLLKNLFNKSFIMCMICLELDFILLLDVHYSNSYVYWRLGYLFNNYIRCSNSFLIHTL
jgi:hypothetical protein